MCCLRSWTVGGRRRRRVTARRLDAATHAREMRARGFWGDRTIDELLVEAVAGLSEKVAVVAYRADRGDAPPLRIGYAELGTKVARAAGALRALGVGRG